MNSELQLKETQAIIQDIECTNKMCQMLLNTPHYKKMGADGIFAIVAKAKSIKADPLECLNGEMYYVKGKVELSSAMMNQLIRKAGHSITKDRNSNNQQCILHGKRKDNGDTWTESFSMDEAKQAGILNDTWRKYPRDMLFARALSRLARQLFPDVIKGCYVQGELNMLRESTDPYDHVEEIEKNVHIITEEEATYLNELIGDDEEYRVRLMNFMLKEYNATELNEMPRALYDKILQPTINRYNKRVNALEQIEVA